MKILHFIAYVFHKIMRFIHMVPGSYQSRTFEYHHKKMKKYKGLLAVIAIVLFLFSQSTTADYLDEEMKTINTSQLLLESSVIITSQNSGSGFYISENEIITNQHVVLDAKSVFIKKSDGQMCFADVVFKQVDADLALLKTDCKGKPIKLAESVKVGQSILVMGNPMYNEFFVSKGVVGLHDDGKIVHDAITDIGSSGGPVVDMNGELVGVSHSISKSTRLSFAIDIKTLSYFLYQANKGE